MHEGFSCRHTDRQTDKRTSSQELAVVLATACQHCKSTILRVVQAHTVHGLATVVFYSFTSLLRHSGLKTSGVVKGSGGQQLPSSQNLLAVGKSFYCQKIFDQKYKICNWKPPFWDNLERKFGNLSKMAKICNFLSYLDLLF